MAIYNFHKTGDAEGSIAYISKLAARIELSNSARLDVYEEKVRAYMSWFHTVQPVVVSRKMNVRLPLSEGSYLAGEVSRLDIDVGTGGYRAVLLTDKAVDVKGELRMPLLQLAIAGRFGREVSDVAVGVQCIDASKIEVWSFSEEAVKKAFDEATSMAAAIDDLARA